jgi:hypothetical protein
MRAQELKWAAGGFVGGFLLCYLLIGAFRSQPHTPAPAPAPGPVTLVTPATTWPSGFVRVTNIQLPELRIIAPDRWTEPVPLPRGYTLDLIDTHYQLPPAARAALMQAK